MLENGADWGGYARAVRERLETSGGAIRSWSTVDAYVLAPVPVLVSVVLAGVGLERRVDPEPAIRVGPVAAEGCAHGGTRGRLRQEAVVGVVLGGVAVVEAARVGRVEAVAVALRGDARDVGGRALRHEDSGIEAGHGAVLDGQ